MRKKKGRKISGWIVFNKPYGMTSTQTVSKIKYLFQAQKAGHAGTLDPLATGMLPIALGEATKTIPYVVDSNKQYTFTVNWGEERTTDDLEGEVQNNSNHRPTEQNILKLLNNYIGDIEQTPPIFSAIKINGDRAYDLARQNIKIELKSRIVRIEQLKLIEHDSVNNFSKFKITCGKGTYIRSIARDLGRALKCCGYVAKLHRDFVQPFDNSQMIELENLLQASNSNDNFINIDKFLLPIENMLTKFANYELNLEQCQKIQNGNNIFLFNNIENNENIYNYVSYNGKIVALGILEQNLFKPKRVFNL